MRYVSCFVQSIHSYLTGLVRGNLVEVICLKFLGGKELVCSGVNVLEGNASVLAYVNLVGAYVLMFCVLMRTC